ncbi:MAG: hypothetical protein ABI725_00870 [Chloroflexota bacterium]
MNRVLALTLAGLVGLLVLGATQVLAHEGSGATGLAVEPSTVSAGDKVVLAGSGLEPNTERRIVLAGAGMTIDLGPVITDAAGMFQIELTIPGHVPSGIYELQCIGDETLTTPLAVTAGVAQEASPPAGTDTGAIVAREHSLVELGLILALVVIAGAAGTLLVLRAERFRGDARG